jgi:alpha-glucosidase
MAISFVGVRDFAPNGRGWTPVGPIASVTRSGNSFVLKTVRDTSPRLQISILSTSCFRVKFDPLPGADSEIETSPAVVTRDLGAVALTVVENSPRALVFETGAMRVQVDLQPYRMRVYRGAQLVSADAPDHNLVYIPGQRVAASVKSRPVTAKYCGFGEKGGATLLKINVAMTNFNFDNFIYSRAPLPADAQGGPLNPAEPLYASIPWLMEVNPRPVGDNAGPPYCYGLFLDNPSQSFFDTGAGDAPDLQGRYWFGAVYGGLDYYFLLGDGPTDVLGQYTVLTGRSAMPPKYVFGFHQGCYGYYDRVRLEEVADAYRAARIPIDGLHIDIDFQDNYRVFTHSEMKFPQAAEMIEDLRRRGFKCSAIVTPLLTNNPLDETGRIAPYPQREALLRQGSLLYNARVGEEPSGNLFVASVSYGSNRGSNPYPYPPLLPNRDGVTPLGTTCNYPDLGRPDVQAAWGRQYAHLIEDLGIDMVWQDMTCPAAAAAADTPLSTLPLDLMVHNGARWVPHGTCHNAYALFLLKATFEGVAALRPERRPFVVTRGGYAGLQRYAAIWTGDTASSWDFLRISIPQVLNLGLSGVPIAGGDVGGFATGPIPEGTTAPSAVTDGRVTGGITDPELFIRWMQVGSFLPWFRNHYIGYDKQYQEVYAYGEPVTSVCRTWVEFRYRMLQIYYDAMYQWTQTGMPIARALFLNDPHDPAVYDHLDDQFFVGQDILVAPIVSPVGRGGAESAPAVRDVYLPAGSDWYAFSPAETALDPPIGGGQTIRGTAAGLAQVPLYVRAGAILPMHSVVEQYVGELPRNPLDIIIYPGPDADYLMYRDDGTTTRAATEQAYRTTRISHRAVAGGRSVRLQRTHDRYTPPETFYQLRLPATSRPAAVSVGGKHISAVDAAALAHAESDVWGWDAGLQTTVVKVFDTAADQIITVLFA